MELSSKFLKKYSHEFREFMFKCTDDTCLSNTLGFGRGSIAWLRLIWSLKYKQIHTKLGVNLWSVSVTLGNFEFLHEELQDGLRDITLLYLLILIYLMLHYNIMYT